MRFCPRCGARFADAAFTQEYWAAEQRHVVCWCPACATTCTVVLGALVGTEPEH